MHLKLITNLQAFEKAVLYFPKDYLNSLKHKEKESIIARLYISKLVEIYFGVKNFLPKVNEDGVPIFEDNIFWSISHKKDLVFVGVSDRKMGLDVELIKPRDESLLNIFSENEYKILGGKTWENFYILWTGKEAIIKKKLGKLDNMKKLVLEKKENIEKEIDGISFSEKFFINGKVVRVGKKESWIYSLCK